MNRAASQAPRAVGASSTDAPTLRVRGITKRYGAVQALRGADLDVHRGEVVALVGDNGAGKSTLVKIIAGAVTPTTGTIEFEGRPVTITGPKSSSELGIATIYQDLALCDNLDVVSNLFLGAERAWGPRRGLRWLDGVAMEEEARALLDRLDVHLQDLHAPVATLSGGQRQSIAIARALIGRPKVVILDEPTAALGVAQTAQVLQLILRLRDEGHAVVLITHNLADVFAVCSRIVVLRQGANASEFLTNEASQDDIVAAITGSRQIAGGLRAGLPGTAATKGTHPND